jgi:hypothetical protein
MAISIISHLWSSFIALARLMKLSGSSASGSESASDLLFSVSALCACTLGLIGILDLSFLSGQFLEIWPCLLQLKQWPSARCFSVSLEDVEGAVALTRPLVPLFLFQERDLSARVSMTLASGVGILIPRILASCCGENPFCCGVFFFCGLLSCSPLRFCTGELFLGDHHQCRGFSTCWVVVA